MQVADAVTASRAPENTPTMVKKIGKTTYKVHVHFSQQLMAQYGAAILGQAVSNKSAAVQTVANTVYEIGRASCRERVYVLV